MYSAAAPNVVGAGDPPAPTIGEMEVVATPEALELVRERGGRLYVWLQKAG
jgi:hypothetical protein